ncbi:hypothetical protein H7K04_22235 [Mycolicibacterium fluoranthenivorans]|nr:hypothetical protein [Mycolicibacterium fluoranthenivorans]
MLTFVTVVAEDLDDRDKYGNPEPVLAETAVPGCRFRPLPAAETTKDGTDVVRDQWRATCPPAAAAVGATSRDAIKVDGVTYQIVGRPEVFGDLAGRPFKVTIICERAQG